MNRFTFINRQRKNRISLSLLFTAIIFIFMLVTVLLTSTFLFLVVRLRLNVANLEELSLNPEKIIYNMGIFSILLGTLLSWLLGLISLKPVNMTINAMDSLASGNFKTRLNFKTKLSRHPVAVELVDSFNHMAEELEKTEMLRSDFINNYSHEFKTPIVSIAGFADLLMEGNLSEEEKAEYIRIISEESHRLSDLATNIMNLTKIENQVILTDVTHFNLSEQIRSSILLLENKWTEKQMQLETEFDEYYYDGNKELLKQVWVNLVDNAVKFSDYGGILKVGISETTEGITVTVSNTGDEIPPEKSDQIFNKFYQADESHATTGNGIGLSVVKAIVELHGGSVSETSKDGLTVFSIMLPK